MYIHSNATTIAGRVQSGLIFVCPDVADNWNFPRNQIRILGYGVLDASGHGASFGGCGAEFGIGTPDGQPNNGQGAGGAGHGGRGGTGISNGSFQLEWPGGNRYDTVNETNGRYQPKPVYGASAHVGSGGGGSVDGGAGGGMVAILAGVIFLQQDIDPNGHHKVTDGAIRANGGNAKINPSDGLDSQPGGGSGGTIMLETSRLAGNAYIHASGGSGSSGSTGAGGGGGGGVVELKFIAPANRPQQISPEQAVLEFSGQIDVTGGLGGRLMPSHPTPPQARALLETTAEATLQRQLKLQAAGTPMHFKPPLVPLATKSKVAAPGLEGMVFSPMCHAGFAGRICKPCEAGQFMNHSTQGGSCGECTPGEMQTNSLPASAGWMLLQIRSQLVLPKTHTQIL